MALVIGNSNYLNIGKLQNTKNDATAIQRKCGAHILGEHWIKFKSLIYIDKSTFI